MLRDQGTTSSMLPGVPALRVFTGQVSRLTAPRLPCYWEAKYSPCGDHMGGFCDYVKRQKDAQRVPSRLNPTSITSVPNSAAFSLIKVQTWSHSCWAGPQSLLKLLHEAFPGTSTPGKADGCFTVLLLDFLQPPIVACHTVMYFFYLLLG